MKQVFRPKKKILKKYKQIRNCANGVQPKTKFDVPKFKSFGNHFISFFFLESLKILNIHVIMQNHIETVSTKSILIRVKSRWLWMSS